MRTVGYSAYTYCEVYDTKEENTRLSRVPLRHGRRFCLHVRRLRTVSQAAATDTMLLCELAILYPRNNFTRNNGISYIYF